MSAAAVAMTGALVHEYKEFRPLLEEHLDDNEGEVLPHLLLSDVIRFLAAHYDESPDPCSSVIAWLDREYQAGEADIRDLIGASGIEMIPSPGQPGAGLRGLLGPTLRQIDPWRQDPP